MIIQMRDSFQSCSVRRKTFEWLAGHKEIMLTTAPSSSMLGWTKYFGFGMFILDPGSVFIMPEPESRVDKIPDPGSASKNLSIFNPKN
jgi:hypothetical protein